MVSVRFTTVRFSDGVEVSIPSTGVVLLVGPNNAGKSQVLKDLLGFARNPNYVGRAVRHTDYVKQSEMDLQDWVTDNVPQVQRQGIRLFQVEGWGEVSDVDILRQWNLPNLSMLTSLFVFHADGTSRLSAGDSQQSLDFSSQVPVHPVQRAYREPQIEEAIDQESRAAFGLGVTVDRYGGSLISLRLGEAPHFEHDNGRPTEAYLTALKSLPKLEEQGDGVRSYLGLVLHLAAGRHQILLIDEPEAFLHPPQARRLGSVLAQKAELQQVFIATHSTDVLQGALEGGAAITIVRVTRDGNVNHPSVLDDSSVRRLWSDPLLRYSNVLDGLFHDAVVLCESDSDCRYYAAVLDHLPGDDAQGVVSRHPQLLFTHCGGKARMASVVDSLRAVSVPVIVVADFDLLRDAGDVERIVTSLGGEFSQFEGDLRLVASALTADEKPLRKLQLKEELDRRIDELPRDVLTSKDAESLRAVIRADSGWDKAKRSGLQAVPQGQAYDACERLLAALTALGLFIVPVGELERFAPGVPGHGPAWVTAVLEQKLHEAPGASAVEFVAAIRDAAAS